MRGGARRQCEGRQVAQRPNPRTRGAEKPGPQGSPGRRPGDRRRRRHPDAGAPRVFRATVPGPRHRASGAGRLRRGHGVSAAGIVTGGPLQGNHRADRGGGGAAVPGVAGRAGGPRLYWHAFGQGAAGNTPIFCRWPGLGGRASAGIKSVRNPPADREGGCRVRDGGCRRLFT